MYMRGAQYLWFDSVLLTVAHPKKLPFLISPNHTTTIFHYISGTLQLSIGPVVPTEITNKRHAVLLVKLYLTNAIVSLKAPALNMYRQDPHN